MVRAVAVTRDNSPRQPCLMSTWPTGDQSPRPVNGRRVNRPRDDAAAEIDAVNKRNRHSPALAGPGRCRLVSKMPPFFPPLPNVVRWTHDWRASRCQRDRKEHRQKRPWTTKIKHRCRSAAAAARSNRNFKRSRWTYRKIWSYRVISRSKSVVIAGHRKPKRLVNTTTDVGHTNNRI